MSHINFKLRSSERSLNLAGVFYFEFQKFEKFSFTRLIDNWTLYSKECQIGSTATEK